MTSATSSELEYRNRVRVGGLTSFPVRVEQTDLFIRATKDLTGPAYDLVRIGRQKIEDWIERRPEFLTSLTPLPPDLLAPRPVREMLEAGRRTGVGPMAAVAGAMAEFVGRGLWEESPEGLVVENGGDIFIASKSDVVVGLFAGSSPLSLSLGLSISPEQTPVGVCTSSGTVGHSLSLGRADAATVVGESAALADAAATALGNRIKTIEDMEPGLDWVLTIPGVRGAIVFFQDKIGFLGDLKLVSI